VFIEDLSVDSMLYALTIRSPASSGSIESIEIAELPGEYTLITAKDIPGENWLDDFRVPILASSPLSYVGEAVALLAGPDLIKLDEFAARCIVKVKPSEPENTLLSETEDNFGKLIYRVGEPEKIYALTQLIISGTYSTGIQEHWYSEPHGALAILEEEKLTVHTASQWPFHVKRSLSGVLKIPDSNIDIVSTELGLHLDGKLYYPSLISCQAALCAYITGRPVKLMLTRSEDFRYSPKRNNSQIVIGSALGDKGKILGTEIQAIVDLGGQDLFAKEILAQTSLASLGLYRLGETNLEAAAVKSKLPPQGPMEGFGLSQGFFASEMHASRIADTLHQDPAEWRKSNCLSKSDTLPIGIPLKEEAPLAKLIDSAASMSDYYRKWASYELIRTNRKSRNWDDGELKEAKRGVGIAVAFQGSGSLYYGADKGIYGVELTLGKDGALEIKSSISPGAEENARIWRSVAGKILGVEESQINITCSSSGIDSGPAFLSRNIAVITQLVERCSEAIGKQRFRDPLPITVRHTVKPEIFPAWNNKEEDADSRAFSSPAWGAAVAEIEIDSISFNPRVRGIWLIVDGGRILSQARARSSLRIAAIQALNWASREQIIYKNGEIPQDIMQGYELPSPEEIPPIYIDFLSNDSAAPKGIGELPYSCIPAAFVQAVSQAMDHPFEKIPLKAEDVWEVEKYKKAEALAT
jgi:CO/xanthine dehydrogenase Mo-binding subunit